jgi:hypothetical protein
MFLSIKMISVGTAFCADTAGTGFFCTNGLPTTAKNIIATTVIAANKLIDSVSVSGFIRVG